MSSAQYKFANFVLDPRERTLCRDGESLKLKSRAFQVLESLVENAGKVITKEEFFERVWRGAFVEENNLTVAVAQIRKVLGESREAKFIETVPRKGYRFVAEVERVFSAEKCAEIAEDADESEAAESNLTAANFNAARETPVERSAAETERSVFARVSGRKILAIAAFLSTVFIGGWLWRQSIATPKKELLRSIAVLPFATNGNSPAERVFAETLTEELTARLGRITEARVSAYNAAAVYDQPEVDLEAVETDLQIDGIITGKMRSSGEIVDLQINLNDLRAGKSVWEKRYSFKESDLRESQYGIARDIAQRLGKNREEAAGDGGNSAAANYEAYRAYLTARHHLGKRTTEDYEKAVEHFTAATVKDGSFADAHSGLATARVLHGLNLYAAYGLASARSSFPAAKQSALRALDLNRDSDEALAALAFVGYVCEYDWKSSEENFRRAVRINPNNIVARRWYAEFLHRAGRFDEAFAVQRDARALAPNSAQILNETAWGAYLAGRLDEAVAYVESARRIDSTNAAALYNASEIYEQKSDYGAAVAVWSQAMTVEGANRKWIGSLSESFQTDGYRGFARAKIDWLESLIEKDYVYPTDLAKGYAALGENEKALEWLEKGLTARVPDLPSVKYAPAFKRLRDDERFQNIIRQMNFPR